MTISVHLPGPCEAASTRIPLPRRATATLGAVLRRLYPDLPRTSAGPVTWSGDRPDRPYADLPSL